MAPTMPRPIRVPDPEWHAALAAARANGETLTDVVRRALVAYATGESRQAVDALDALDPRDPEVAHGEADKILLAIVPVEVREAYERIEGRAPWWASA